MEEKLKTLCATANDLKSIRLIVEGLAERIGASSALLPTYGTSIDGGHPHIEHNSEGFHYVVVERGREQRRNTTNDPNELLYWVFNLITFEMACAKELKTRVEGQDCRRLIWQYQLALLEALDLSWRTKCEAYFHEILLRHPFDDLSSIRATLCGQLRNEGMSNESAWEAACKQYPFVKVGDPV